MDGSDLRRQVWRNSVCQMPVEGSRRVPRFLAVDIFLSGPTCAGGLTPTLSKGPVVSGIRGFFYGISAGGATLQPASGQGGYAPTVHFLRKIFWNPSRRVGKESMNWFVVRGSVVENRDAPTSRNSKMKNPEFDDITDHAIENAIDVYTCRRIAEEIWSFPVISVPSLVLNYAKQELGGIRIRTACPSRTAAPHLLPGTSRFGSQKNI
ncbi:hypothetical protein B0H34DRAFT_669718 [Crassisporium funariophilum]|nr:hypothetical protein B0H34DRAFT_669718 [Crassisporium funariophilum]